MDGQPNYERMYHKISQRRGEELRQLKKIAVDVADLTRMFTQTDRIVADCAKSQVIPLPARPENIHGGK